MLHETEAVDHRQTGVLQEIESGEGGVTSPCITEEGTVAVTGERGWPERRVIWKE